MPHTLKQLERTIQILREENQQLRNIILKTDAHNRYYDEEQLASMFHYANGTCLKNVVRQGRFPQHDLKVGHKWLWKIERIEQFIESRAKKAQKFTQL